MASKDLQLELPMARRPQNITLDQALVLKQPNKLAAINLCIQLSGLEDKEIYMALGIDAGQWTRIKKGDSYLPDNKESDLMRICGNIAPLMWSAAHEGYELRPMMTELEAQLAETKAELAAERERYRLITEFVRESRGG